MSLFLSDYFWQVYCRIINMKPSFEPKIFVKQLSILLEFLIELFACRQSFLKSDIKFGLNLLIKCRVFISIDPYVAAVFTFIQLSKTRP